MDIFGGAIIWPHTHTCTLIHVHTYTHTYTYIHTGFSLWWLLVVEHRLLGCMGLVAPWYLVSGMWCLPGRGIEPVSSALSGSFLTTEPPRKSFLFNVEQWLPEAKTWLVGKDPDAGKDWRQEKGMTENEIVGWHHWLNGHEFEQNPGDGEGQGSLVCCSSWGGK